MIDEIDTHQRLVGRTLRSLTPVGVIQESQGSFRDAMVVQPLPILEVPHPLPVVRTGTLVKRV
ncbi:hypothetical protein EKD04_019975 [Chloroflexales bacterium ZM16-3]|nr:hypothetical protein [Chloroflexales bacterium ZM16-3]